jgi:hypothetical protein
MTMTHMIMTLPQGYTIPKDNISAVFDGRYKLWAAAAKLSNEQYSGEELKKSTMMQMDYILSKVVIAAAESNTCPYEFDMQRFADLLRNVVAECEGLVYNASD